MMQKLGLDRLATLIILTVVVIAGGVVVIIRPETLDFSDYVRDVAIAAGLLAVGHGIDPSSKP